MSAHFRPSPAPSAIATSAAAPHYTPACKARDDTPARGRTGAGWWIVTLVIGGTAGWVAIIGALLA